MCVVSGGEGTGAGPWCGLLGSWDPLPPAQCRQPPVLPSVPLNPGGHSGNLAHSPACRPQGISLPWGPPAQPFLSPPHPSPHPLVTPQVPPRQARWTSLRQWPLPSASRSSCSAGPQTSAPHPHPSKPLPLPQEKSSPVGGRSLQLEE